MTNEYIIVTGASGIVINSTAEAIKARDALLATAQTITEVNSDDASLRAADILKEIKQLTRFIEGARTEAKSPILEKGKQIDALAKQLTAELEEHAKRIANQIGFWTAEQARKVKEAMEAVQREATRLVQEKADAERKLREQELAEQQELARQAAATTNEKRRKELEAEAQRKRDLAEHEQAQRDEAMQQDIIALRTTAQASAGERPTGIATRTSIKFEVTDIKALHAAHPFLVTLSPNNAAITSALKTLRDGEAIPGVRHWKEATAIVR
jgi:DNA polymerase III alpha subunit (gram-positive type)